MCMCGGMGCVQICRRRSRKVVMVGLTGAGKTTILYTLKLRESIPSVMPTYGVNVENIQLGRELALWDMGGLCQLWKHYLDDTDGIIYVVDSADREKRNEAKSELMMLLEMKEVKGVPLLVLANKQDLPGALSAERLTELLSLRSVHDRKWIVHSTVANRNEGLKEAIKEFISLL